MDFSFTPEQEKVRERIKGFAQKELLPKYSYWDKHEEYPREQILKLAKKGFIGLTLPEKYGGMGADSVTLGIAMEEVAKGDFSCGYPVILSELAGGIINRYGSEEQKEEWLPAICRGERVVTVALTEPHCGSDAVNIRTSAVRNGREYVLNGRKHGIDIYLSEGVIIWAKTKPELRAKGISCFLVPGDTPGLTRQPVRTMGCKGARIGNHDIRDMRLPLSACIGEENKGFYYIMNAFDCSRVLIALWCLGAAQAAVDDTIKYARVRTTFGKPLAKYEGISFPLVENYSLLEAARLLCYKALWLRDQGLPHTKEAAMAKLWVPKLCVDIIHHSVLAHGWIGYTDEIPQEQRLRDVIGFESGDGSIETMKLILVRELIGTEYLPYV